MIKENKTFYEIFSYSFAACVKKKAGAELRQAQQFQLARFKLVTM